MPLSEYPSAHPLLNDTLIKLGEYAGSCHQPIKVQNPLYPGYLFPQICTAPTFTINALDAQIKIKVCTLCDQREG